MTRPRRDDKVGSSNQNYPGEYSPCRVYRCVAITLWRHPTLRKWGYSIRLAGLRNRLRPYKWKSKADALAAARKRIDRHMGAFVYD